MLYLRNQFGGHTQLTCLDIYINIADGPYAAMPWECEKHWHTPVDTVCDHHIRLAAAHQVADLIGHEPPYSAARCGRREIHVGRHAEVKLEFASTRQLFNHNIHCYILVKAYSMTYHSIFTPTTQARGAISQLAQGEV
ncbi:MAG: hypothetical protein DRI81_15555 [Chloroflexi bacterium]|nr:MAG: hypothetical protein DRI81_15555 [Chloroflexota bacterium]